MSGVPKPDAILGDPCVMTNGEHYRFAGDGAVVPLADVGRRHIEILGLDEDHLAKARRKIVAVHREPLRLLAEFGGEDDELRLEFEVSLGYPADVPDPRRKPPPANARPDGMEDRHHARPPSTATPRLHQRRRVDDAHGP